MDTTDAQATTAAAAAASSAAPFVPSTVIGSYLSQGYQMEVEMKKTPGFICGRQAQHTA
jgi:hypothetical protein